MSLTTGAPRPSQVAYMAEVAGSANGQAVRAHVLAALDLHPGQTALDVGCGPGTNLSDLAAGVTSTGSVIGVDADPEMIEAARRHVADYRNVEVRPGDAHALPVADASVDRARTDRVLQHVADPAAAITELRRVTRPGGMVTLTEPDWATLAIAADDLRTSAIYTSFICSDVVRNASIGRNLARHATAAGFALRSVQPLCPVFSDFDEADRILGLTRNCARAVSAGRLQEQAASRWLETLRQPPFLATCVIFAVAAEVRR